MNVLTWLMGSKIGKWLAGAGIGALTLFFMLLSAFRKGVNKERERQKAKNLNVLRTRIKSDAEIDKKSPSDRRALLNKWVR